MFFDEKFYLVGGQVIEVKREASETLDILTEKMNNLIFNPKVIPGQKVNSIFVKSANGKEVVSLKVSEIIAYTTKIAD